MKKAIKKLRRPLQGRQVAGVAAGLANYFDIDVVVVRAIWILLLIPGGLPGLVPYIFLWLVIPDEG